MTNSTDNKNQNENKINNKKTNKKKGPIRFEAVIPTAIIIGLIYGYFYLFFDSHLKKIIEFAASSVHGAEVNVGKIESSVWGGYFKLFKLQVTDKEQPARNLIQIEKIHFELVWDALLRAKFVVKEASIENIMAYSPRVHPGKVFPKVENPKSKNELLNKVEETFIDQAKSEFNNNVLGDVASILDGTDPNEQLKNLQAELKSDAKIKELEKALEEKKQAWKERIEKLPQKPQIDALVARSKTLKFNTKDPKQFAQDLKEVDKIIKEGDKIVKEFNAASKSLKGDVTGFNNDFKSLDDMIKQDIKDLQNRLKIPDLNTGDFAKGLFGKIISEKLGKYKKYISMAQEYMPPKKSEKEKADELAKVITPQERKSGIDFKFPKEKSYPTFWLQHAKISSKESASEFSGNLSGEAIDLTTQPTVIGKPFKINVEGNFPKQNILGFSTKIIIDHTTQSPTNAFNLNIEEYPLDRQVLSDSSDVKFAIQKAKGNLKILGSTKNNQLDFKLTNNFQNINYDIQAKSKMVQEILTNITNGIPLVDLNASARGEWNHLNWSINSNLGDELSKGFNKELQAKIADAKAKLNDFVNNKIKAEREKLTAKFESIKGDIEKTVSGKQKELETAKKQAQTQLDKQKGSSKNNLKEEAKKAEKKLKKLLGF
jgi:uncharacterized protein (TIGR03545 family)